LSLYHGETIRLIESRILAACSTVSKHQVAATADVARVHAPTVTKPESQGFAEGQDEEHHRLGTETEIEIEIDEAM
jgi:hypothetical protein